jgi:hypothetical protein
VEPSPFGCLAPDQGPNRISIITYSMVRYVAVAVMLLLTCLVSGARPAVLDSAAAADGPIRQFYQQRGGALAWSGGYKAEASAHPALAILSNAANEGLDSEHYRVAIGEDPSANDAALTNAVLTNMRDLAVGRPELRAIDPDIGLSARQLDFPSCWIMRCARTGSRKCWKACLPSMRNISR